MNYIDYINKYKNKENINNNNIRTLKYIYYSLFLFRSTGLNKTVGELLKGS